MSTEYGFINRNRKQQVEKLDKELQALKQHCLSELERIFRENPELEDDIDNKRFQLERSEAFRAPDYDDESLSMSIGVATGKRFIWSGRFRGEDDIRKFLAEHPDCYIEDEYRQEIAVNVFLEEICKN